LAGLSILPIDEENVVSATKFFNQVNGLCESYLKVLNDNEKLYCHLVMDSLHWYTPSNLPIAHT
jgi:hypothetical protein